MADGDRSVWVFSEGEAIVQRIDEQSARVVATIELGRQGAWGDVTFGGGYVWVTMPGMPVAQIDPRRNLLIRRFLGWDQITTLRFGAGSLWHAHERIKPPS
jgi:hypothetical protein